jgi:hypothetical protein
VESREIHRLRGEKLLENTGIDRCDLLVFLWLAGDFGSSVQNRVDMHT